MLSFIVLILILFENSLTVSFPYNAISLPFLTYLAYKKGKEGMFTIFLVCLVTSGNEKNFIELLFVFMFVFIISYILSKTLSYEKINIFYYSGIQFIIYGIYLYLKLPYFYFYQGVTMIFLFLLFNYIFIKISKGKI